MEAVVLGGIGFPGWVLGLGYAEETVASDVDPEVDLLASLVGLQVVEVVLVVLAVEDAAVGEAEKRAALLVEHERFAAEMDVERNVSALPFLRHRAGDVEPAAVPGVAPVLAQLDRTVLECEALVVWDGFLRHGDFGGERHALQYYVMLDALERLADAGFVYVVEEVGHGCSLVVCCGTLMAFGESYQMAANPAPR